MGYSMVNKGKAEDPRFANLGVTKDLNIAFYPAIFDFANRRLRYRDETSNGFVAASSGQVPGWANGLTSKATI